jgi:hypothetical protein
LLPRIDAAIAFDPTFRPVTSPTSVLESGAGLNAALTSFPFARTDRFFTVRFGGPLTCRRTSPPLTNSGRADIARISSGTCLSCAATRMVSAPNAISPIAAKRFIALSSKKPDICSTCWMTLATDV